MDPTLHPPPPGESASLGDQFWPVPAPAPPDAGPPERPQSLLSDDGVVMNRVGGAGAWRNQASSPGSSVAPLPLHPQQLELWLFKRKLRGSEYIRGLPVTGGGGIQEAEACREAGWGGQAGGASEGRSDCSGETSSPPSAAPTPPTYPKPAFFLLFVLRGSTAGVPGRAARLPSWGKCQPVDLACASQASVASERLGHTVWEERTASSLAGPCCLCGPEPEAPRLPAAVLQMPSASRTLGGPTV
ncbi:hypothetical protein P7K49_027511 [Saguinus oedipus]|uniref:Uncharacterized protein n=1 Tax=Saguinus oedipus TaxID=9490 RepID=A0ABQ9UAX5_SAGOE|nr:hypothetical protein P7K49_027511 [Saguinus oedipus]